MTGVELVLVSLSNGEDSWAARKKDVKSNLQILSIFIPRNVLKDNIREPLEEFSNVTVERVLPSVDGDVVRLCRVVVEGVVTEAWMLDSG